MQRIHTLSKWVDICFRPTVYTFLLPLSVSKIVEVQEAESSQGLEVCRNIHKQTHTDKLNKTSQREISLHGSSFEGNAFPSFLSVYISLYSCLLDVHRCMLFTQAHTHAHKPTPTVMQYSSNGAVWRASRSRWLSGLRERAASLSATANR